MNSRKVDPLSGLFPYQKWMRVTGIEMFTRTICDRYHGKQMFTSQLDRIINPKNPLSKETNPAYPSNVFTLRRAIERLTHGSQTMMVQKKHYTRLYFANWFLKPWASTAIHRKGSSKRCENRRSSGISFVPIRHCTNARTTPPKSVLQQILA